MHFGNCVFISVSSISLKYAFYLRKITIFEVSTTIMFFQLSCIFLPKNLPKPVQNDGQTLPKLTPKTYCLSTIIFSGFGVHFGSSWASKSAALLAAPGVLDPTAFYACINILLFLP